MYPIHSFQPSPIINTNVSNINQNKLPNGTPSALKIPFKRYNCLTGNWRLFKYNQYNEIKGTLYTIENEVNENNKEKIKTIFNYSNYQKEDILKKRY